MDLLKFRNDEEEREMNEFTAKNGKILNHFIKKRKSLLNDLKKDLFDFRKSQDAKAAWRKNRYKMMKGIKSWHKSIAGKRFHRKLGYFLRDGRSESQGSNGFSVALSSLTTHLIIEDGYFIPDYDTHYESYYLSTLAKIIISDISEKVEFGINPDEEEFEFLKELCGIKEPEE